MCVKIIFLKNLIAKYFYFISNTPYFTFHISHFIFHISYFTFHISHFIFHITFYRILKEMFTKTNTQVSRSITKESNIKNSDKKSSNIGETTKTQDTTTYVNEKKNNQMTPENAKALHILKTEGSEKAVKYMFNPTGERQLSYAEMRSRFG